MAEQTIRQTLDSERTVLVVDDDPFTLGTVRRWLGTHHLAPICVATASAAMAAARSFSVRLAIIDFRLLNGPDGLALGVELQRCYGVPFILISAYFDTASVVRAVRGGAVGVLDKPLKSFDLLAAVKAVIAGNAADILGRSSDDTSGYGGYVGYQEERTPAERWARAVLAACRSRRDPKTVAIWARAAALSPSGLRDVCTMCGVCRRRSRDLARFMRAVVLSIQDDSALYSHLTASDPRTLSRFFAGAGQPINCRSISLRNALRQQEFVPTSCECLRELGHLAANDPLFSSANSGDFSVESHVRQTDLLD